MLVVTQGKVVIDHAIYEPGEVIDFLSADEEDRMVAEGIAARPGEDVEAEPEGVEADASKLEAAKNLSKPELQARCRELGLSDRGNKAELQARLDAAESELSDDLDDEEPPELTAEVPK